MPTAVHEALVSLQDRWREVNLLIDKARDILQVDAEFHNVLCRAATVLIAANIEGYVRDVAKAIVADVNSHSTFKNSKLAMKRTFCGAFFEPERREGKDGNARIERLIATFDGLDTKFTIDAFLFEGKHDDHRNPSPQVVERIARKFGIKKVFHMLQESRLDEVFSGSASDTTWLVRDLCEHLQKSVNVFPYEVGLEQFDLHRHGNVPQGTRTFWETYLDDLLKQRHLIAHGASRLNGLSVDEVIDRQQKALVLQYGFTAVLCNEVQKA